VCWFCGKPGHNKKNCWNYKKAQENVSTNNQANTACDSVLVLSTSDTNVDSWVLDSGTSLHATSCRQAFTNFQESTFGKVFLGDNKECDILGKGDITLNMKNGDKLTLTDVRYVPMLKRNLISVSHLIGNGCNVKFSLDSWKITKGLLVMARGKKQGNLYIMDCIGEVGAALPAMDSGSEIWHKRLGHMSQKGLQVMLQCNQLPGLNSIDLELCEHCLYGKQCRTSFVRMGHDKKTTPLELVHSDIFGLT